MDRKEQACIIEGILFAAGEPVEINSIAKIINESPKETQKILSEMKDLFDFERRGIQLKRINTEYQLATRTEHYEYIKQILIPSNTTGLSKAALETLSIIAYKQPITKVEIESIRGVKSDKSLQTLMDKSLVLIAGRLNSPGKPMLYETTKRFLKYVGVESLEKLPEFENFCNEVEYEKDHA